MPRITLLFILIILLTACTPNATPTPLLTVASSPVVSITPTIAATEIPSIVNPITPESMDLLIRAGYLWDAETGELKMANGYIALTLQNGKWVDTRTGTETSLEALKLVKVNGVGFDGKNIVVILTREVNGEKLMYNPIIDAWVIPIDVLSSQQLIDRNAIVPTFKDWGTYENVSLEELPEITWDDFHSGKLFYSEQLALNKWPSNVRIPMLQYNRNFDTNLWTLSEYQNRGEVFTNSEFGPPKMDGRPILWENDGVKNLDAFKMKDPITDKWMVVKGQQYLYKNKTIVLHLFFGDAFTIPVDQGGAFNITQRSLSNPPWVITEPNIALRPGDYSGVLQHFPGGQTKEILPPQDSVLNLLGYDGIGQSRSLLPEKLQALIAQFDKEQPIGLATENYPVGDEIFQLQQLPLAQFSFSDHALQGYLRTEDDPLFKLP